MIDINKKSFFKAVFFIVLLYSAVSWILSRFLDFSGLQNTALIVSGILGTVNIVVSFVILTFSYNKEFKEFMVNYFGGMAVRVVFLLATIFMVLKFMRIDIFVFILSLFVLYFIFQALEIYYIQNYQKRK